MSPDPRPGSSGGASTASTVHRTLLLTTFFPPNVGGAERAIAQLADGLGAAVVVVAPGPVPSGTHAYRRVVHDLHRGWIRPTWLAQLPWLIRTIRRERCTRVVCAHYGGFVTAAALACAVLRVPFLVWIHGLDLTAYQGSWLRRALLRWNLRAAEWVFANSEPTRQLIIHSGVPAGKTFVSNPGVTPFEPPAEPELAAFRATHDLGTGPVLLTVGRLVARKGHERVLRALAELVPTYPAVRYLVVGDGPQRGALEQEANTFGVGRHVRFVGRLAPDALRAAYALADVFIMLPVPDPRDVEGYGLVYAEALTAGRAVLATRTGGVTDILRDGESGRLLEPTAEAPAVAEAIRSLLDDPNLRSRLGAQGRAFVLQERSVERQVEPVRTALRRAASPTAPRISVVVPVWQDTEHLARTLASLLRQTHRNREIVVVDDGSSLPIEPTVRRFPGVRYVRQEHGGAPVARNRGFAETTGAFVLFCDADVELHPRMLERCCTALLLHPGAAFAYGNFRFGWRTFDVFDFDAERLRLSNYISTMSLVRRERFPGFDPALPRLQDWDLWLTVVERGGTGTWVPARLFRASVGRHAISAGAAAPPEALVQRVRRKHNLA